MADGHIPCETNPSLWTSNDEAEREAAAFRCQGCPVRQECAEASGVERLGVWGAHIRLAGSTQW
ncbi:WhiB family transcriptional regulator [Allobranchiibius sp. CTAmp26]|uniref:WhiB family transcriptional regulator n=1 Tax=Allobranchiibius sp. CTAmp26 TaxID=2815214 RepID=UPI0035B1D475